MPARNKVSMEREEAPEPKCLLELLQNTHREIKILLKEMQEILFLPTVLYELYPRIRVAIEVHHEAEEKALYEFLRSSPRLIDRVTRSEDTHRKIFSLIRKLDQHPWRLQQVQSGAWKRDFLTLQRMVVSHFDDEEKDLFPLLKAQLSSQDRDDLGDRYRFALQGEE